MNTENPDMEIRYAVGFDLAERGQVAIGRHPGAGVVPGAGAPTGAARGV